MEMNKIRQSKVVTEIMKIVKMIGRMAVRMKEMKIIKSSFKNTKLI